MHAICVKSVYMNASVGFSEKNCYLQADVSEKDIKMIHKIYTYV